MGRQGAKADSDPSTCGKCRLCGQPCQRVCWIDSCCRTTATCYEITGRTCTQRLHHQGPHRCGALHDDAVGRGDCDDDGSSKGSGGKEGDDDYKSRKRKGRDKDKQRVAVRREQQAGKATEGGRQRQRQGRGPTEGVSSGAGSTAPRTPSEMLDLLKQEGVTASAEATRKPSKNLLPLLRVISEEEKQWTDGASSEVPPCDAWAAGFAQANCCS